MKHLIMSAGLLFFSLNFLFAQDEVDENKFTLALSVINNGQHGGKNNYMPTFSKVFNFHGHSSLKLDVRFNEIGNRVIEGMESIYYYDYKYTTNFYSNYGDEKYTSERIIKGKGPSQLEAMQDAWNKFANNAKNFPAQLDSINAILNEKYVQNCVQVMSKTYPDDKLYVQSASLKYIPKRSKCYEAAQKKITEITKKQELLECTETIRKMNISVESKTYDANRIVARLINIPGTSPCAAEALKLAKKIGQDKAVKFQSGMQEKLNIYINNFSK